MKSPSTHFIIALLVSIVTFVAYGLWYSAISARSKEVVELQNEVEAATETMKRIASAHAALAEIAGDEAKVQGYFVPESGVVSFINELESRGSAQKATVEVLSVSKSGSTARPMLSFTLSIKGAFNAIMRTVGAIEYAPYDISITSLSIGQDSEDIWYASLALSVGSVPMRAATSTKP